MTDITVAVGSVVALAAFIVALTEAVVKVVNGIFKVTLNGVGAWITSFILSVGSNIALAGFKIGMYASQDVSANPYYITGLIVGVVVCLLANGIFSTDVAKGALTFLKIRVPVEKP
jgi:hypothetical protein